MASNAKVVRVRKAGSGDSFALIPGNTADFSVELGSADDTIFGASYTSTQTTLGSWEISSNALYRGFAGYNSVIKKTASPTPISNKPMSVEDGNTYIINDISLTPWDWNEDIIVSDDEGPISSDEIKAIDPLFGRVTFVDGFTPDGNVTVDAVVLGLVPFGKAMSFDLSQTCDTTETTSFEVAQANGGYSTHRPTLREVSLSLSAFYRSDAEFLALLDSREKFVVEINPDGEGKSIARGVFRIQNESNSGDVGGDEETSVEFVLAVPEGFVPFSWYHDSTTTMPVGLRRILDAYVNQDNLDVEYLPEGVGNLGKGGEVVLTDASISSSVDGIVEASFSAMGTGVFTVLNEVAS